LWSENTIKMERRYDFLVIGSGLAGLSYALKVSKYGTVAIITKDRIDNTNTSYAQGGIASVMYEPDNFEKHIQDTLIAGDGLCNEEVVRMVVNEAPRLIKDLVKWGVNFDKDSKGKFSLSREGGHSEPRILHHQDNTGAEIQRALVEEVRNTKNIDVFEYHFAVDLITQHHLGQLVKRYYTGIECYGAYVFDTRNNIINKFLSKITLIATGGIGNIYQTTTNPVIATGDGIAMVYRAKGIIEDMEFVQFHPTSFYEPTKRPSFLITEALRGAGAVLKNNKGIDFVKLYDERGSLAPRDIVARAIDNEMKISGSEYVLLDCTTISKDEIFHHFPNIYNYCLKAGYDITKEPIPVVPAAHFLCGGIKVDINGKSWINRLYAAGECSCTGLHGANRLASNSLLEALVFSDRAANESINLFKKLSWQQNIPEWNDEGTKHPEEMVLITQNFKEMQQLMSYYVGIVRSNERLKRAMTRLEIILNETEELYKKSKLSVNLCELWNMINVGYLIIKMAMARKHNKGLHYNIDYSQKG
jgi:L-aspartate oxidase